jgi:hypothetical protein
MNCRYVLLGVVDLAVMMMGNGYTHYQAVARDFS